MGSYNISLSGMTQAADRVQQTAVRVAKAADPSGPADIIDLSEEIVALMVARNSFAANAKAAQSMDEVQKSLLSLLG